MAPPDPPPSAAPAPPPKPRPKPGRRAAPQAQPTRRAAPRRRQVGPRRRARARRDGQRRFDPGPTVGYRAPRRRGQSLAIPTLKLGVSLAIATASAAAIGSALGLPVPIAGGDPEGLPNIAAATALPPISLGTAPGAKAGPVHPVVGKYEYGDSAGRFGASRGGRAHEGVDVFANTGTPLVAVRPGIVVDGESENGAYSGGRGNYITVYSPLDRRSYVYLHMLHPSPLEIGDRVAAGQIVGQVGCTGSCWGPHLHFEIRLGRASFGADTRAIDPLPLLERWPEVGGG